MEMLTEISVPVRKAITIGMTDDGYIVVDDNPPFHMVRHFATLEEVLNWLLLCYESRSRNVTNPQSAFGYVTITRGVEEESE